MKSSPPIASPSAAQPLAAPGAVAAQTIVNYPASIFGEIVGFMMHYEHFRALTLADLEWLVLPAIASGQFMIAKAPANENGFARPLCVALWATVSPDIDQQLAANIANPVRLSPQDWRSGDIPWLMEAIGDAGALQAVYQQLAPRVPGQSLRARMRDADGNVVLGVIEADKTPVAA